MPMPQSIEGHSLALNFNLFSFGGMVSDVARFGDDGRCLDYNSLKYPTQSAASSIFACPKSLQLGGISKQTPFLPFILLEIR